MKRETMNVLRRIANMERWSGRMPAKTAQDTLAELERLRHIERKAMAWKKSMGNYDDYARAELALIAALNKGGQK